MAIGDMANKPVHSTREFVAALVVGLVAMVLTVVATLYVLGYLPPTDVADGVVLDPRINTAEDLTPTPKPTAVWRFRSEWQKPPP